MYAEYDIRDIPCYSCGHYCGNNKLYSPANTYNCNYRYKDIIKTIKSVSSTEYDRARQQTTEIKYVDFEGYERSKTASFITEVNFDVLGRTLSEIWDSINCEFMRCINLMTGYVVQINNSPVEQRERFGRVTGLGVNKKTLKSYSGYKEINYSDAKQWVLIYYKPSPIN